MGWKGKGKHPGGRPTKLTPEVITKLEQAFSMGCTDKEACLFADISMPALYNFQNRRPEFVERKELLKEKPMMKARSTVLKNLDDPEHAEWYLERKGRAEFSTRTEVPLSGELKVEIVRYTDLKD